MRLADMHIHTTFSPDGKSSMEEQCIKAIDANPDMDEWEIANIILFR